MDDGADGSRPVGRRAIFVDRDGTLNPDLHYLNDPSRLELNRGVGTALRLAHDHGYLVICVTNQSGIDRGLYTSDDVDGIHRRLNELLAPHEARVDAFYYCPHAPERHCECRKPGTKLFADARREWGIDFGTSAMIGDRALDVQAGEKLGLVTCVVRARGHETEIDEELARERVRPDMRADSFLAAVSRVLARG
jgi:D-glycero-D-manno-heptose 1,7-bisphosphate phosphatase